MNQCRTTWPLTSSALVALLLSGMGCASAPLLRLPAIGNRAARSADADAGIGRVELGSLPAVEERVDPEQQRLSVLLARGRLHEADLEPDEAARTYRELLKEDPQHVTALHRLAVVSAEQGDLDEASDCFQKALQAASENADLHSDYGYFCYLLERWDEAEQHLTQALALNPAFKAAHTNLGLLAARRGDSETALSHFRRAGCSEADSHRNLALAHELNESNATATDAHSPGDSPSRAGFAMYAN